MPDTTPLPGRLGSPSAAEITALIARLGRLTDPDARFDRSEREAFLADKRAVLDRIAHAEWTDDSAAAVTDEDEDAAEREWHPLGSARLDRPVTATELDAVRRAAGRHDPDLTDGRVARADEVMAGALARHGITLTGDVREVEQSRRDQLNQWATSDQTDDAARSTDEDSRTRGNTTTYSPEATS